MYRGLLEKRPAGHETVIVPTSDDPTTSATHSHESAKNLQGRTKTTFNCSHSQINFNHSFICVFFIFWSFLHLQSFLFRKKLDTAKN